MVAASWWRWKVTGKGQVGSVSPSGLLSLHVVSGPVHEVSVWASVCCCFRALRLLTRRLTVQKSVSQENQAETVSFLQDLVLEVVSHPFCCGHKLAQVQGGREPRPHL